MKLISKPSLKVPRIGIQEADYLQKLEIICDKIYSGGHCDEVLEYDIWKGYVIAEIKTPHIYFGSDLKLRFYMGLGFNLDFLDWDPYCNGTPFFQKLIKPFFSEQFETNKKVLWQDMGVELAEIIHPHSYNGEINFYPQAEAVRLHYYNSNIRAEDIELVLKNYSLDFFSYNGTCRDEIQYIKENEPHRYEKHIFREKERPKNPYFE